MQNKNKSRLSVFAFISFVIFAVVMTLYFVSELSVEAADIINSSISHTYRRVMAAFGDIFPFSLFEVIVFSLPLILIAVIFLAARSLRRGEGTRFLLNLLAVVLLIYSGHTLALGIAYNTTEISERMKLPDTEVTSDKLADIMTSLRDEVNSLSDSVTRDENGGFVTGYSYTQLSEKILESYDTFEAENGFPKSFSSVAKGVRRGDLMSYLGITGIYTFYTGEANVNTAYPDYDIVFTAAHELSHQRGILRENEANFMAYLVTSSSEDINLRYSAALNMYQYIASALYKTDRERYSEIARELSSGAAADILASVAVSEKYGDTLIEDISRFVNDLFLKSNGTDGVVSYGRVVELTVAYFEQKQ